MLIPALSAILWIRAKKGVRHMPDIQEISNCVQQVAAEYPIKKCELFGSYAEGLARSDSDIDLLIEFASPSVSLLMLNSVKYRLEDLLQTDVDLIHAPLPTGCMIEIGRRVPVYGA